MLARRFILCAMVLGSFGSACTAIIFSKVSAENGYTTDPNFSGSNSTNTDPCALLADEYGNQADANACATCIQKSCPSEVAYACNSGTSEKPWFSGLKSCAQNPWNGQAPAGQSNGDQYGCQTYAAPEETVSDNGSDTQREPEAHNCVTTNCMQGATPACDLCDVTIQKSTSDPTRAELADDPCGSCMAQNCLPQIVSCCPTNAVGVFVAACAFTAKSENKATCLELGKAMPDAGDNSSYFFDDAGVQCVAALGACFKANCAGRSACQ